MADLKEYKNRTEELEEIIDAIKENAVQKNDLLPFFEANSEKITKTFNMLLIDLHKATDMKNLHKDELAKEKIIMEDLEKRMESEEEKVSKVEAENRWLKSQLAHHQSRVAEIVNHHENFLNELGASFRKAPALYEPETLATEVDAITEVIAQNNTEVKRVNQKNSDRQVSCFEALDEDVVIQSIMEVQNDIEAFNLMTERLKDHSRLLENRREKLNADIKQTIHESKK